MYIYQCENAELHLLTCAEETPTDSQVTDTHHEYQKPSPEKRKKMQMIPQQTQLKIIS